jgi:hypothetical protein
MDIRPLIAIHSDRSDLERIWKILQYALKLCIPFLTSRAKTRRGATAIKRKITEASDLVSNARLLLRYYAKSPIKTMWREAERLFEFVFGGQNR